MTYIPGKGWDIPSSNSLGGFFENKVLATTTLLGCSLASAAVYFYFTSSNIKLGSGKLTIPGLHNLGNTCYANSLLQGLAGLPSVVKWLDSIDTKESGLQGGFLDELKDLIIKLNTRSQFTFNAGGISSALMKHKWNIAFGAEHDLYELFNVFVSTWEKELGLLKKRLMDVSLLDLNELTSSDSQSLNPISRRRLMFKRCADIVRSDAKLKPPTFGLTATELRCNVPTCRFKKIRYDAIGGLSVSIPRDSAGSSTTLEYLLRRYFLAEVIRGATCDRCKERNGKIDSGLYKKQGFSKVS
ncbi:unnamed protein product [Auanema sp. JU1783]|nr:unnamed protein product [Auanema sp. JU1783]